VVFQKNLSAPIKKNQIIGRLEYSYNNKKIGKVSILASETVGKAKYTDYLQKLLLNL
jgi:D-alanyl-D-alanine carboxypeptidase (penicillin-binding protein 5/6)